MEAEEAKSIIELYTSRGALLFAGSDSPIDSSDVVVVGVPYEETTSFLPGTRFGPSAVREASVGIEFYSLRAGVDLDEAVRFHDLGDVAPVYGTQRMVERVARVVEAVSSIYTMPSSGRLLVLLGGEHTITLGVYRGLRRVVAGGVCIVSLDAHLDMRDEYLGERYGHANVMRRIMDEGGRVLAVIGARAFAGEEIRYAASRGVRVVYPDEAERAAGQGVEGLHELVNLRGCSHLHVTVDMDVYDPAYAPGVGNPEPEGITPRAAFNLIHGLALLAAEAGVSMSFDVVELSPPNDCGRVTSSLAAKTVVEASAAFWRAKNGRVEG